MLKKETLFYLIKSLTKSEKRYFKLQIGKGDAKYLRLFETIDRQEQYDEDAIKSIFADEPFVRQLTAIKNYLRNQILRSLRNFHQDHSPETFVRSVLDNVEILYQKGLYRLCEEELDRARKKIDQYELETERLSWLSWKRRVLQALHPQLTQEFRLLIEQQEQCARGIWELYQLYRSNIPPLPDGLPVSEDHTSTLLKYTYYQLYHYQKNIFTGQSTEAGLILQNLIDYWDQYPKRKRANATVYLSITNSMIAYWVFQKNTAKALEQIQQLKAFLFSFKRLTFPILKALFRLFNLELELYRDGKDLTTGLDLLGEINSYITRHQRVVPEEYLLSFWFQFAYLHFLGENYKQALHWVNTILNYKFKDPRQDLITYTHWLNLLTHFELKNHFVMRYFIDGLKRRLKKLKQKEKYEQLLLQLLLHASESSISEQRLLFQKYHKQLLQFPIPKETNDYVDFYRWMERHL